MVMNDTSRAIYNMISPTVTDIRQIMLDLMSITYMTRPLLSIIKSKVPRNPKTFDSWYKSMSYVLGNLPRIDTHKNNENHADIISQASLLAICQYDMMCEKYAIVLGYMEQLPGLGDYGYFDTITLFDIHINYPKSEILSATVKCANNRVYNLNYLRKVADGIHNTIQRDAEVVEKLMFQSGRAIQPTVTREFTEQDKERITGNFNDLMSYATMMDKLGKTTNSD